MRTKLAASVGVVVVAVTVMVWRLNGDPGDSLDERSVSTYGVVDSVDPDGSDTLYHYTVDGQVYHGSSDDAPDPSMMGKDIPIHYDPDDPSDSWLDDPSSESDGPGWLSLLTVAAALGILVWWFMARGPWRRANRR